MNAKTPQSTAYRWLLWAIIIIGAITSVLGAMWLVMGGGMFGSPLTGAFGVDPLTGLEDHWAFWTLWVVLAGPIALLPFALLELFSHAGGRSPWCWRVPSSWKPASGPAATT